MTRMHIVVVQLAAVTTNHAPSIQKKQHSNEQTNLIVVILSNFASFNSSNQIKFSFHWGLPFHHIIIFLCSETTTCTLTMELIHSRILKTSSKCNELLTTRTHTNTQTHNDTHRHIQKPTQHIKHRGNLWAHAIRLLSWEGLGGDGKSTGNDWELVGEDGDDAEMTRR